MRDHVSIGDLVREGHSRAWRWFVGLLLVLVYLAGLGYSAVHQWRLLTRGLDPDLLMPAAAGIITLELMALALPLGLHHWFFDPYQRLAALLFYVLDLALIFLNVGISFTFVGLGKPMPTWVELYSEFVLPATPITAMVMSTALALLDPEVRRRAIALRVRAAASERLMIEIAQAATDEDIEVLVREAGEAYARVLVRQALGIPVTKDAGGQQDQKGNRQEEPVAVLPEPPEGIRPNGAYQPKPGDGQGVHPGEVRA